MFDISEKCFHLKFFSDRIETAQQFPRRQFLVVHLSLPKCNNNLLFWTPLVFQTLKSQDQQGWFQGLRERLTLVGGGSKKILQLKLCIKLLIVGLKGKSAIFIDYSGLITRLPS